MPETNSIKYLSQYQEPNYWVKSIELQFNIETNKVSVIAISNYYKNIQSKQNSLCLDGSGKLIEVRLNEQLLSKYTLANEQLIIDNLPDEFSLRISTEIDPYTNKSCMGLYASNGNLFTQCEPEGFRKITYYQDRPDVMAVFTTSIIAAEELFPVLLSNGNLVQRKNMLDGKIKVTWEDPFKKPAYLFALVAGKFAKVSDTFTSKSQKSVLLEVYSAEDSIAQCQYCLSSLKQAMLWDEQRFGLEYDLERYMIVASGDFNMGAMENKGLNIFNTKYVLADNRTASDTDFINVEAVVGHEYFHNWTGNRVTCRDWFQLSLKEGLTVFRDQEFTADLHSRVVKRIQVVKALRQLQFAEDASPLAHPVRPDSYLEINNFYTMTIYEKGAEVVRMYQTLLGKEGFRRGIQLYFARHDGYAVTCDDFCRAMQDANNFNLSQFMLWYSQAGTPLLKVSDAYDPQTKTYTLNVQQIIPDTPGQSNKKAMLIPLSIGLLNAAGQEIEAVLTEGKHTCSDNQLVLLVAEFNNKFVFQCSELPTPSLGRGFSAPVNIDYQYTQPQLVNLAANDSDSFNRWEAMQTLYRQAIKLIYSDNGIISASLPLQSLLLALERTLSDTTQDPNLINLAVGIPSFSELSIDLKPVDATHLDRSIQALKEYIANYFYSQWLSIYQSLHTSAYTLEEANIRALKNTALSFLMLGQKRQEHLDLLKSQYFQADNMTDQFSALSNINDNAENIREELLQDFQNRYQNFPLVMDKWFMLQSQTQLDAGLEIVRELLNHPLFDQYNPNKLYSLVRAFTSNIKHFHSTAGYQFIADEILRIDKFNPSVAGRIAHGFSILPNLNSHYQGLAKLELQRILAEASLSKDVYELISKTIIELV